jgi:Uma2 family endonuclease
MRAAILPFSDEASSVNTELARVPMSFEAYLTWDPEHLHGGLVEWVDGEVHVYMSATELHQRVLGFLFTLLRQFIELQGSGTVLSAPFAMRAVPGGSGREPDITYVSQEHLNRIDQQILQGPADLVVEIISKDSVSRDQHDKFQEYETAGVREYWIIDPRPEQKRATFYVLNAENRFRLAESAQDGAYHSTVLPGLMVKLDWLWGEPPPLFTALTEILGFAPLLRALEAARPTD